MEHLCAAEVVYGDGTFYVSPSLFLQLYTLHAMVGGQMFPLVFFLLPDKATVTYDRAFRLLKEAVEARGLQMSPQHIQMDFESAAKNAVSVNFPTTLWRGCLFHYTQCVWKKTQGVGLQGDYNHDEDITRFVRRAAVLPLVPVTDVDDVLLNALADMPDDPRSTQD
ncbi:uncharacterized protein LOC124262421 [Haliotis rubra]|uniref:uncharacterized protein LOC124262421 n=1 Tax=Haliotis rubra TaxID=36100 RepID=UPI001EE62E5D|nr:uncharacterized protein LOC124262421 [Haliotis rubra]